MRTGDLPDLFPSFETRRVAYGDIDFHLRIGGEGPPLLLLHGYPQTHVMWHRIAPKLAANFQLFIPDLPGYGQSSVPPISADHLAYSKRCMAEACVGLMSSLGHKRFCLVGHDRGARVSYRLALDHPASVERLAVLDILPTAEYWAKLDRDFALGIYHWAFLAQPSPFPENLIAASAINFLEHTLASWTKQKSLSCFSPEALKHYRDFFAQPERIAATCEDYRAGAKLDVEHDEDDQRNGRKITCPVLALWGNAGIAGATSAPADVWRHWADNVQGCGIDSGHFIAEENPDALLNKLLPFLLPSS